MSVQIQFTALKNDRKIKKNRGPKIFINIILILFIAVNLAGMYAGNIFYKKAFEIDTKKEVDHYDFSKSTFSEKRFNSLNKEEVSVTSTKNNYKLYGTYLRNPKATKDTVILVHGLSGSRWTVLKYIDMYLDRGFNILIYDGRNHGFSGGDNITYGYYEKYDLDRWVNWVYSRNKGGIIGVHGESMGAATALLHSQLNEEKKRVSFYISDSSYSDLTELFKIKLREDYKIDSKIASNVLLFYADKVNKLKNQFYIKEVSPQSIIKEVSIPIFFIHGEDDDFVPTEMTEDLYKLKDSNKELYISPKSQHVQAIINNKDEYREKVYNFLDSILPKVQESAAKTN
jgi:fermentation-respiration switch protein FrsA (DUF1100 family)